MEEVLEIYELDYKHLFQECSFSVSKNKITAISGANNCGKTTLLRILSTDLIPLFNKIYLNGRDITEYSRKEYDSNVQVVFPNNTSFKGKTILDDLCLKKEPIDMTKIEFLMKELNLNKDKEINKLNLKEIIKLQISEAILKAKSLILIDELDQYFELDEINKLMKTFHKCCNKYDLSFLITILNLENTLLSDKLLIIHQKKIILEGPPLEVLEKDNWINKAGLKIPFMIDLSVKLRDYDLIDQIELKKDELVNELWK